MTYQLHLGDCIEGMRGLSDKSVDHVIADPPYSEHVHGNAVSTDAAGDVIDVDFGFGHLSDSARLQLAEQYARITKRWLLIFSDVESAHLWRLAGEALAIQGLPG
jgi:site-specific DNA-methyltransferase (adenine-specific)